MASRSVPTLPVSELARWVHRGMEMSQNTLVRSFREWIRSGMPAGEAT